MITYSVLRTAAPTWDPIHQRQETKTVKFDSHDRDGRHIRRITRDGGVVTVECAKTGRTVEIPWSACVFGAKAEEGQAAQKRGRR